jgi:hypothetical protein
MGRRKDGRRFGVRVLDVATRVMELKQDEQYRVGVAMVDALAEGGVL